MKKLRLFCVLFTILFIGSSCEKEQLYNDPEQLQGQLKSVSLIASKIKIAVLPDIHYMHPDLLPAQLEDSPSLLAALGLDRKLPEVSDPILRKAISELMEEKPDIVLFPGDLTINGERIGHEVVQGLLQDLENAGIKVYVVPGNNDILNPDALSYATEPPDPVTNLEMEEFVELYGNFGYNEAVCLDENSLSYICKPFDGLWILGIDNIKYTNTPDGVDVTGAIDPGTLAWIEEMMEEARENDIRVLAMMHFGILEHYEGQQEPLMASAQETATALMNAGIELIFTGHYHANDIVSFTSEGKTLYDIQTGSLVTPPCPYRVMELDDHFINIDTRRVTSIDEELPDGTSFLEYCNTQINNRLNSFFVYYLHILFGLPEAYAAYLAPFAANAYRAHFAGDEKMPPSEREKLDAIPDSFSPLVEIIKNIWTDLAPSDNKIHIKLK